MPTPFFEPTLRDALLCLDDDEIVVADAATRGEIESARFFEDLRFVDTPSGRARAAEYLGRDRAAVRARRVDVGTPPSLVRPEDAFHDLDRRIKRIIVATSAGELTTTARLSVAHPWCAVHSLKNEIHPAVSGPGDFGQGLRRLREPADVTGTLVILAVMRSGSYLLAEMAARLGLGNPQEHVKDALVNAIRERDRRDMSVRLWWRSLQVVHRSANGWFATKLISHYVERLRDVLLASESTWLDDWIGAASLVTLVRNDRVRQAVSAYRAQRTGIYRARSDSEAEAAASAEVPYDFGALLERYRFINDQTAFLEAYANTIDPGGRRLDLAYEYIAKDLGSAVKRLGAFAGVEVSSVPRQPRNRRVGAESASVMATRFRRDLEEDDDGVDGTSGWRPATEAD